MVQVTVWEVLGEGEAGFRQPFEDFASGRGESEVEVARPEDVVEVLSDIYWNKS